MQLMYVNSECPDGNLLKAVSRFKGFKFGPASSTLTCAVEFNPGNPGIFFGTENRDKRGGNPGKF